MAAADISKAIERARSVLTRRPEAALHADDPAVAGWDGGTRVVTRHANGTSFATDMPVELGGAGNEVSPGWLLRAGLASCLATRIAMEAAATGIRLSHLEVSARSTSDVRGLLGMAAEPGVPITPAPSEVRLEVSVAAPDVAQDKLRALVETSFRCSPVSAALEVAVPVALRIDIRPG